MVAAVSLLLILLITPLVEIVLFIQVGGEIGALPTVGLCVLTAVIGAWMLRRQGLRALMNARARLERNEAPVEEVFDGLFLGLAAVLLLVPGFFTDALGALLLVPGLRRVLQRQIQARARFMMATRSAGPGQGGGTWRSADGTVIIEGEYSAQEDASRRRDRPGGPDDDPPLIGR
ncbi:FxsA family protein [Tistrella sp. BH-R2-4]|uniref:FxsA family protein n=1 Tax=Tistrella arctica TaxID=3133430 RepID=A0ABU9YGX4_9PROT